MKIGFFRDWTLLTATVAEQFYFFLHYRGFFNRESNEPVMDLINNSFRSIFATLFYGNFCNKSVINQLNQ